jgi:selenide,water dikinase
VPLLPEVVSLAEAGMVPGGTKRNMRANAATVQWHPAIGETIKVVLSDAQTSGGLLVATPDGEGLLVRLTAAGVGEAAIVGEVMAEDARGVIEVEP